MAPHSSTLAWKIPWMEEPGRLQSMGSLRVGHNWATSLSLFNFVHCRRKLHPTPVLLPGESQGQGSLVSAVLLWLLIRFSRVRLCATPEMAAHQAPPSLGFSRQEHWSGLPFPSPMHESEKWKWSRSVVSDPQRPHGLQPSRLLRPWDFPGKSTGVGCHRLLHTIH